MSSSARSGGSFGFASWSGTADVMQEPHAHDDIEVNVSTGVLEYLLRGRRVHVVPGSFLLFWGAQPHQLVSAEPEAHVHWLTIPLDELLAWQLPAGFTARVLGADPIIAPSASGRFGVDAFERWERELRAGRYSDETARLEIQAHLRRTADGAPNETPEAGPVTEGESQVATVARMASYAADNSHRPISVGDVAAAVHLHPGYAMSVFKRVLGVSIAGYINTCRIHEAQRLLLTTRQPPAEIAHRVGYGSLSQFYERFRTATGTTPAAYRRDRR